MKEKLYLMFQQSELDGVQMYRALINSTDDAALKDILKTLRAAEGRHAGVWRHITGRTDLRPTAAMETPVLAVDRILGRKATYLLMGAGETAAYCLYQPFALAYPQLKRVAKDELDHGVTLFRLALRPEKEPAVRAAAIVG